MKLYIDTSNREKIVIGLDEKRFEMSSKKGSSQMLLPFIIEVLEKCDRSLKDIKEIEVNTGPGSFTGLRVGVSVANTLAFALKVPIDGKKMECDIIYT